MIDTQPLLLVEDPPVTTDNYGTESDWSYGQARRGNCPKCGNCFIWNRARERWECVEHGQDSTTPA